MNKRYRIKNKFRFITFTTIFLVATIFYATAVLGLDRADSLSTPSQIQIEVQSGDTLWEIAENCGPDFVDTRKVVYEICKLNQVSAETIYPGQILLVPEYF